MPSEKSIPRARPLLEILRIFLRLGCTSFGGPVAHLGYFHREFVVQRRWLSAEDYADLVALCQFLPGPASSQVVFALGYREAGWRGAAASSFAFLFPSAVLMTALGCGIATGAAWVDTGWVKGLTWAAVAVVAHAVWSMARQLCPDWPRALIAVVALAVLLVVSNAWIQVVVLALAGGAGALLLRFDAVPPGRKSPPPGAGSLASAGLFALFLVVALLLPWLMPEARLAQLGATFYRAGSLVFGGGHVVLPWLREGTVGAGWLGDSAFLAGYGAAQAVPGPLFSFAGYLGAASLPGPWAPLAGVAALLLLFLPAWLIVHAALPVWAQLRSRPPLRRAMAGVNAAVVGLLAAVLAAHLIPEALVSRLAVGVSLAAFGLLVATRLPAWAVVLLCSAAGGLLA